MRLRSICRSPIGQDGLKAAKEALQIFRQLGLKKFQVREPQLSPDVFFSNFERFVV